MTHRITYTLKELATLLSPQKDAEAVSRLARQLRHWTNEDLLQTVGAKHTGTGVSRRYAPEQVRLAAILMELNRYHVPITVLSECFETLTSEYSKRDEWKQAVQGKGAIYLMFAYSDEFISAQLFSGQSRHPMLEPKGQISGKPMVSAITINLSRLFAQLEL
ncbi:hypothetical protein [Ferrovibrio sp.]|uniref:hypothetical protein n=1 Tax=Ferrovibrio sp. TaxID=1917215 RepID=UPI0035B0ED6D